MEVVASLIWRQTLLVLNASVLLTTLGSCSSQSFISHLSFLIFKMGDSNTNIKIAHIRYLTEEQVQS